MKDKTPKGIIGLDALINNGLSKDKLDMIMGSPKLRKSESIVTFEPIEGKKEYMVKMPITGVSDEIIQNGCSFIQETLKMLKDVNFNVPKSVTKYEKFGDTVFPVTYYEDGMIVMDYPPAPLK